jgi:hypothetical protein
MAEPNNEKWSAALGKMLCDRLTVNPSITGAAKFLSVSPRAVFLWLRASSKDQSANVPPDQSKWGIVWPVEEGEDLPPPMYLHEGVIQAQKLFRAIAETQLRALLADPDEGGGQVREVLDGTGKPAFEVDTLRAAHALEMDDDDWELTYGKNARRDDVFARDERGALVPKKVRDPLPSQTLIHLARSLFGDTFNPSDRREVDTNVKVETLVIGSPPRKKVDSPLRAELEARLREIRANPDRASARPTGPVQMIGHGHNDPEEKISSSMSDDVRPDLRDHPRAYIAEPSHVPKPAPSYARPNRALDTGEQIGRGAPPAGGMKVR